MGEQEGRARPSRLFPNGLLANEAASVNRDLDLERWAKAEERTAELISRIQPNQPSEDRRSAVADYVQRLITKCFPCQVFTFGSVPLKTYLPDGDIDLTAFSDNETMKDTWANQVRDTLQNEEKDENAEFSVKEVQYIQAEVKLIKCLVENIVVDISFNQLGGLCTLCFLEEVDHLINQDHLFKRSIILIKAWCYYESRVLGAHHGLISTYALETLVLYIFHVFNKTFTGPLEVLYRFLEFFSRFDWDNFCVSLWGPVPISSLPLVKAEPPLKDSGELLLSKLFIDACSSVYAVYPGGQDNQGQPFVSKHFNVIDPLRINNNLGRSVSKGNFYRIRSAFAFGAKKLASLLDCSKEDLYFEVNHFFMNTWERHGRGNRPDAPRNSLSSPRLSTNPNRLHKTKNSENKSSGKITKEDTSICNTEIVTNHVTPSVSPRYDHHPLERSSKSSEVPTVSFNQNQKRYGNFKSSRISNHITPEVGADRGVQVDVGQRSSKPDHMANDVPGRDLFARTRSSPELTDTYSDTSSRGRPNRGPESGNSRISAAGLDAIRRNLGSGISARKNTKISTDNSSFDRHITSIQTHDTESNSGFDSRYREDSSLVSAGEEAASALGMQGMLQEEQDLVNMMSSSMAPVFNGQVHVPMNLGSPHLPLSLSQLASMGFTQRSLTGMVPANFPMIRQPWVSNMPFPSGWVPSPMTDYFPGIGLRLNPKDLIDRGIGKYGSVNLSQENSENDFWPDHDGGSASGVDLDNGSLETIHSDDQHSSIPAGANHLSWTGVPGVSSRDQVMFTRVNRGPTREDHSDYLPFLENSGSEVYLDDRNVSPRHLPAVRTSSSRSKTSSENSWDGSSAKVSKAMKEKRERKSPPSSAPSAVYGSGKTVPELEEDDHDRDWNSSLIVGNEMAEQNMGSQAVGPSNYPRHHISSIEHDQMPAPDSMNSVAPVLLEPGYRQRAMDGSGAVPFTFYPTGPPVPVFIYNFPTETGRSENSSHFREGLVNNDSGQNYDSSDGIDRSELSSVSNSTRRDASVEPSEEYKSDILNSDFTSHWQNLQFGRLCQDPQYHGPLVFPSPVAVPPMYLPDHSQWDGPGRPISTNMNPLPQVMSFGPQLVPVAPSASVSSRPSGVYQRHMDGMPRYRSGTGTYLPNPKVSVRDRQPSGARRGSYSNDKSGYHGDRSDRDGNWNNNSKRGTAAGHNHNRSQTERSGSRMDRSGASESRPDRPWTSYSRPDSFHSYQSENRPVRSNSTRSGSANVARGMYPLQTVNANGVSSNGPAVIMLYPYDHNASHGSPAEQLEFGSLGHAGFPGRNDRSPSGDRSSGAFDEQRFHNSSNQRSSPDSP